MNISKLRQSNSAQINADDIVSAPIDVTITAAEEGTNEQPLFLHVAELPDKTYRPSLTMIKLIGANWGDETDDWLHKRLRLFRNPKIRFGREEVGGIEVSHMSHIDGPVEVSLLVKKGQRKIFRVDPLPNAAPARDWLAEVELAGNDVGALRVLHGAARAAGASADVLGRIAAAGRAAQESQ